MKTIQKFITFDGVEHVSGSKAVAHLDEMQGTILCKLAREISFVDGKYSKTIDILSARFEEFRQLLDCEDDKLSGDDNENC